MSSTQSNQVATLAKDIPDAALVTDITNVSTYTTQLGACLVVGGCGFLGHHVVKNLLADPTCTSIAVMCRSPFQNRFEGVTYHIGDITNIEHVRHVFTQVKPHIVINTASPHAYVDHEHAPENFRVNVDGTTNLLQVAGEIGTVEAFVYTSSGPIIAGSGGAYDHADESVPTLATIRKGDPYHLAKALGDKIVLEANGKNGIRTACIRPTAQYGEGDFQLIDPTLRALKDGQTTFWMGYNDIDMDVVYVGNVARAEVLCAHGLLANIVDPKSPKVEGEAFNITDDQPSPPWTFFRKFWVAAGDKSSLDSIWMFPPWIVMFMTNFAEWWAWTLSFGKARPKFLIRERMEFVLFTRTYSVKKARERLGYKPWDNQPWANQDEAVIGAVDYYLKGSGSRLFPTKSSDWPEVPCRLIYSTGADKARVPKFHYCRKNAQQMAMTHNTIFRALNAVYRQAVDVLPGSQDAADMLAYCAIIYDFIHHHQLFEETIYFPEIEKAAGVPGLMEVNVSEHLKVDAGLEKFRKYAETTRKEFYNGEDLRRIIDGFAADFTQHNHDEIQTIVALHDHIDSDALKAINERVQADSELHSDIFKVAPLVMGCQDNKFLLDGEKVAYPHKNGPLVCFIIDQVLARRHSRLWRFNPSDIYGNPRRAGVKTVTAISKPGYNFATGTGKYRNVFMFLTLLSVFYAYSTMMTKTVELDINRSLNGTRPTTSLHFH